MPEAPQTPSPPVAWPNLAEDALVALAEALGSVLVPGDLVLLSGAMGAGKTTWTRGLARGLGVTRPERVRSPTFNICVQHEGPRPLAHVDLFRLAEGGGDDAPTASSGSVGAAAFEALGLLALVEDNDRPFVVVAEWGELWRDPPLDHLSVHIAMAPLDDTPSVDAPRIVTATAGGQRARRRLAQWSEAASGR